jgi:Leucine-rich repeat (LRR) protein
LARNQLFNSDSAFSVLKNLVNLKRLSLANNFLNGKLSEDAGFLIRLEELDLDGNQLTALPESCENWSNLRVFSAGCNMIEELPPGAAHWTKLEMFNIRQNGFKALPALISKWTLMKRLCVGTNKLAVIPDEIASMEGLVELDVRKNELTEVPVSLGACKMLEHLNLGDNKITSIPEELITEFGCLRELYLYRNKLENLPADVGTLTKIEKVSEYRRGSEATENPHAR